MYKSLAGSNGKEGHVVISANEHHLDRRNVRWLQVGIIETQIETIG